MSDWRVNKSCQVDKGKGDGCALCLTLLEAQMGAGLTVLDPKILEILALWCLPLLAKLLNPKSPSF